MATGLTIGQLAKAAQVGVETVRYYQRLGLIPVPPGGSGYRRYPAVVVDRLRFIRRAQGLGFSLKEIEELLALEDSDDRVAIRELARERLQQIESRLVDLKRMQALLEELVDACEHTGRQQPCPIVSRILTGDASPVADAET